MSSYLHFFPCAIPSQMRRVANIVKELGAEPEWHSLAELQAASDEPLLPPMATLQILGGRKEKIRPGDVLGALTGEAGFAGAQIGKIDLFPTRAYVAIQRDAFNQALHTLRAGRIKGRNFRVREL